MDMQSRIYAGVTLDVARLTDLYAAIELVEGAAIVHTATDKFGASRKIHRPSPRVLAAAEMAARRENRPAVKVELEPLAEPIRRVNVNDRLAATKADRKHVVAKSDPRAVFARSRWNPDRTVIDVLATLRRMGLTVSQLDAMKTKHGTLEYTVKRSLGLNRRYKRNRQSGRLGRAEVAL
tara:strand:+ start:507 stop:1043 length:537 start_codon:yes stop_codon:yes gene_type:complete